jgi:hypothetical protein
VNVANFVRSLTRRPVACALILVLAIGAGVAGWMSSASVYQSTAVLVVIPPGSGNPDAMMNPLIRLDNDVAQLAAVVATKIKTDGGNQAALHAGGTGEFTVDTTFGDSTRFAQLTSQLVIVATGSDPASAQRSAVALTDFARNSLDKIQASAWVPTRNNAIIVTSVEPQWGSEVPANPLRSAAAYALGTVLAGVVLLLLYEAVSERISGRRRELAFDPQSRAREEAMSNSIRERDRRARHGKPVGGQARISAEDDDPTSVFSFLTENGTNVNRYEP